MNTTKQQLIEEMMWARELYVSTGKRLGITVFDNNARIHDFENLLQECENEREYNRVLSDASNIKFT